MTSPRGPRPPARRAPSTAARGRSTARHSAPPAADELAQGRHVLDPRLHPPPRHEQLAAARQHGVELLGRDPHEGRADGQLGGRLLGGRRQRRGGAGAAGGGAGACGSAPRGGAGGGATATVGGGGAGVGSATAAGAGRPGPAPRPRPRRPRPPPSPGGAAAPPAASRRGPAAPAAASPPPRSRRPSGTAGRTGPGPSGAWPSCAAARTSSRRWQASSISPTLTERAAPFRLCTVRSSVLNRSARPGPSGLLLQGQQVVVQRAHVLLELAEERRHQPLDESVLVHASPFLCRRARSVACPAR